VSGPSVSAYFISSSFNLSPLPSPYRFPMFTAEDYASPPRFLLKLFGYIIFGPFVVVLYLLPKFLWSAFKKLMSAFFKAIFKICSATCRGVSAVYNFLHKYVLEPTYNVVAKVVTTIWKGVVYVFSLIKKVSRTKRPWKKETFKTHKANGLFLPPLSSPLRPTPQYFLVPIYDGLCYISSKLKACFLFIFEKLCTFISFVCEQTFKVLSFLWTRLFHPILDFIWRGVKAAWGGLRAAGGLAYDRVLLPLYNAFVWAMWKVYDAIACIGSSIRDYFLIPLKNGFVFVLSALGTVLKTLFNGIKAAFEGAKNYVFLPIWNWVLLPTWNTIVAVKNAIKDHIVVPIYLAIVAVLTGFWGGVVVFFSAISSAVSAVLTPIVEGVSTVVSSIVGAASSTARSISSLFFK
jgi:hypothetical protein